VGGWGGLAGWGVLGWVVKCDFMMLLLCWTSELVWIPVAAQAASAGCCCQWRGACLMLWFLCSLLLHRRGLPKGLTLATCIASEAQLPPSSSDSRCQAELAALSWTHAALQSRLPAACHEYLHTTVLLHAILCPRSADPIRPPPVPQSLPPLPAGAFMPQQALPSRPLLPPRPGEGFGNLTP
jgi:hypothetical protein